MTVLHPNMLYSLERKFELPSQSINNPEPGLYEGMEDLISSLMVVLS